MVLLPWWSTLLTGERQQTIDAQGKNLTRGVTTEHTLIAPGFILLGSSLAAQEFSITAAPSTICSVVRTLMATRLVVMASREAARSHLIWLLSTTG